ncbi:HNH endonuclease [bacterium]|nr:HNH endonuclease [bacterium]
MREELFKRDNGFCSTCGVYNDNWQADHILPVSKGGGACNLDNFQTICPHCHKIKTKDQYFAHLKANSSHASVKASILLW